MSSPTPQPPHSSGSHWQVSVTSSTPAIVMCEQVRSCAAYATPPTPEAPAATSNGSGPPAPNAGTKPAPSPDYTRTHNSRNGLLRRAGGF
jgi:hypothetical protein